MPMCCSRGGRRRRSEADALGADILVVTDTPADSPAAAATAAAAADVAENGNAASEGGAPSGSAQNGGAAAAAQLQGAPGGSGRLTHDKQNAAGFDAEQKPLSTCILNGVDYSEARSLRVRYLFSLVHHSSPYSCNAVTL